MGWTPSQTDGEYLWDFLSAWDVWKTVNSAPQTGPKPPTAERYAEVLAADAAASRTLH